MANAMTQERAPHPARQWTAALAVFLFVQLLFWSLVLIGERAVRPANLTLQPWVAYQLLDEAGRPTGDGEWLRAAFEPAPNYNAPVGDGSPRAMFRIPFDYRAGSGEAAFFIGGTPGLREIRLNGNVVQPNTPLNFQRGAADGAARYYMLPPAALRPGANRIDIVVETQSAVLSLPPFSISAAEDAAKATDRSQLINQTLPTVAVSFLAFAILLSLAINWPAEDRRRIRALRLLMILWMVRTYFITFETPVEIPFLVTYAIYYLLEIGAIMALARYVTVERPLAPHWLRAVTWGWTVLSLLALFAAGYGFLVGPTAQGVMSYLPKTVAVVTVFVAVAGFALLSLSVVRSERRRWIEQLVLMVCLTAFVVDMADSAFALSVPFLSDLPLTFYTASPLSLLLGLGVIASIAREASEARRTVVQANQILAARLADQDAELQRSYDAQKQMLQRQVMLEERQRIVRDMHDGIGGQLLGLMMQVRSGGADAKRVEQDLQASIADLRLIVDSMDTAEDGLAETLRAFEHRARPQVEAAGMALHLEHGIDEAQPGPGPRSTLQILRILQEAVTNAMRHSGGKAITVSSGYAADGTIRISVADDGQGMPAAIGGGRGLASMHGRAEALGGTLTVTSEGSTTLTLQLPPGTPSV